MSELPDTHPAVSSEDPADGPAATGPQPSPPGEAARVMIPVSELAAHH